jgi:hypothetical protein
MLTQERIDCRAAADRCAAREMRPAGLRDGKRTAGLPDRKVTGDQLLSSCSVRLPPNRSFGENTEQSKGGLGESVHGLGNIT